MKIFLDIIRNYTDLVLFLIIWLVILLIYILRQKRQLEQEILKHKQAEDEALSRQSKGRLTSLDVMVSTKNTGEPTATLSDPPGSSPALQSSPPVMSPPPAPAPRPSAPTPAAPPKQPTPAPAPAPTPARAPTPAPAPAPAPPAKSAAKAAEEAALLTQYTSGDGGGVEEMERMLERDPNNLQLLDWLAFMYYSNNDIPKAIQTYSRIIEIEPNNASQHYYLGNCFFKNNQKDKALAEWNTVIALKPNSKYARKAQERIAKLGT